VLSAGDRDFCGTGRFEIRRRLGAGAMGVVYEAHDRERDEVVALKVLQRADPRWVARFKREFRSLVDVEHQGLVRLGELHSEAGQWFFTMELVPGVDFLSWVRGADADADSAVSSPLEDTVPGTPISPLEDTAVAEMLVTAAPTCDETRLRHALEHLARPLVALHAAGKVHRDVKPSNVRITPEGRVVLLDFGLVTDLDSEDQLTDASVVGTAAYMAPEQAASGELGPAADWYSVGVMLYEALTGRLPFAGRKLEVLVKKQQYEPPPPRAVTQGVAPDLDRLCVDLLRLEPRHRPAGEGVLERLGSRSSLVNMPSLSSLASLLTEAPLFVGRERELAVLGGAFADARRGAAAMVVVEGESGVGKTALVERFCDQVAGGGDAGCDALVLRGRCYEREQVPYKVFDGIIDTLARRLARAGAVEAALVLGDDAGLVARIFPALRRVPAMAHIREPRVPNPQELRTRAFLALRAIFVRLRDRQPVVLAIDDLQWADRDSLLMLAEVLRPPDAPALLVIATRRPGSRAPRARADAASAPAEDLLPGVDVDLRSLAVEAMPAGEAEILAAALLGGAHPGVDPAALAREADGHPLFLHELARHARTASGAPGALHLDEVIWQRILRLEAPARRLVEVVCVAGAPLAQTTAALAAGLGAGAAGRATSVLRTSHLVRTMGASAADVIEPYHDRIRETVLAHLEPGPRRALHEALANALEAGGAARADPQVLVRHLEAAGHAGRAATQAVRAAERATDAVAFDQAAEFFRTALRLGTHAGDEVGEAGDPGEAGEAGEAGDPGDSDERRALRIRLGEALVNAGRGKEAAAAYLEAARGAGEATALDCRRIAAE